MITTDPPRELKMLLWMGEVNSIAADAKVQYLIKVKYYCKLYGR